ncbi:MAG: alpha-ketoglutarate-dependent dioxygenase AlkB [Candidatus Binatia bacterium]
MTTDLFSTHEGLAPILMHDAEVYYMRRFLPAETAQTLLRHFVEDVPWRAEQITMWGKTFPQPRLIAWYGDRGKNYTYSGIHLTAVPWTPTLRELKSKVEGIARTTFNSVLLNYYRDHRDSIGFHSDDEKELGRRPIIASVSVGEARSFILKHKTDKAVKPIRLSLESGSLLVMQGETQHYWKHGVEKEAHLCGPRINLTFRRICS